MLNRTFKVEYYTLIILALNFWNSIYSSWIDPDSPLDAYRTESSSNLPQKDRIPYELVFSDEFEESGRFFYDGYDSRWTASTKNDNTNKALHFFNASLVTTVDGKLSISTVIQNVSFEYFDDKRNTYSTSSKMFQTGILQGWNKFCFTGGILEISAKLPGKHNVSGHWPAMWLLGNLARHSFTKSSDNIWPWSYDTCNEKSTSNSTTNQLISACMDQDEELTGLHPYQGRGAPEIDLLEGMPGDEPLPESIISRPYFSTSLQIAPAISNYIPGRDKQVEMDRWYNHDVHYGEDTAVNDYFYGLEVTPHNEKKLKYRTNALSANSNLNQQHFESFHKYRLEWQTGNKGYLRWYLDNKFIFGVDANAFNITSAIIPEEPMYLILNMGVDSTWGFPRTCPSNCTCNCYDCHREECRCGLPKHFCENTPAAFLIDYVRIYQNKGDTTQTVGCSPRSHPTEKYIQYYEHRYKDKSIGSVVLKPISHGGSTCLTNNANNNNNNNNNNNLIQLLSNSNSSSTSCGIHSTCINNKCICNTGYTGPTCHSASPFLVNKATSETSVEIHSFPFQYISHAFHINLTKFHIVLIIIIIINIFLLIFLFLIFLFFALQRLLQQRFLNRRSNTYVMIVSNSLYKENDDCLRYTKDTVEIQNIGTSSVNHINDSSYYYYQSRERGFSFK